MSSLLFKTCLDMPKLRQEVESVSPPERGEKQALRVKIERRGQRTAPSEAMILGGEREEVGSPPNLGCCPPLRFMLHRNNGYVDPPPLFTNAHCPYEACNKRIAEKAQK